MKAATVFLLLACVATFAATSRAEFDDTLSADASTFPSVPAGTDDERVDDLADTDPLSDMLIEDDESDFGDDESDNPDDLAQKTEEKTSSDESSQDPDDEDTLKMADADADSEKASTPTITPGKIMPLETMLETGAHLNREWSKNAWNNLWKRRELAAAGKPAPPPHKPAPSSNAIIPVKDPRVPSKALNPADAAARALAMKPAPRAKLSNLIPLLRFYNVDNHDTLETVDPSEVQDRHGWSFKGVVGFLHKRQSADVVPLYRFYNKKAHDHYFSTEASDNDDNTVQQGIAGYIDKEHRPGLFALNEFYCEKTSDHLYSITPATHLFIYNEAYTFQRVAGWIHPLNAKNHNETAGGRVGGILDKPPPGAAPAGFDFHPGTVAEDKGENWGQTWNPHHGRRTDKDLTGTTGMVGGGAGQNKVKPGSDNPAGEVDASGVWHPPAQTVHQTVHNPHSDKRRVCAAWQDPVKDNCRPAGAAGAHDASSSSAGSTTRSWEAALNNHGSSASGTAAGSGSGSGSAHHVGPFGPGAHASSDVDDSFRSASGSSASGSSGSASSGHDFFGNVHQSEHNLQGNGGIDAAVTGHTTSEMGPNAGNHLSSEQPNPNKVQAGSAAPAGPTGSAAAAGAAAAAAGGAAAAAAGPTGANHGTLSKEAQQVQLTGKTTPYGGAPINGALETPMTDSNVPVQTGANVNTLATSLGSGLNPVYRYWNENLKDHYYTLDFNALANGKRGWQYQGIQCYIYTKAQNGSAPIYRYWNLRTGDHYLTMNYDELKNGKDGYRFKGILGYAFAKKETGTVPLYQYYNEKAGDHYYTDNFSFLEHGSSGWKYQKIAGYVFPHPGTAHGADLTVEKLTKTGQITMPLLVPFYRYWNKNLHDHFYTTLWKEVEVGTHGWEYQGVQALVYAEKAPGTVAFHRYWNMQTLDHFYTTNFTTLNNGTAAGWVYEGVQAYVSPYRARNTVPLYGYYNPQLKDHFYTIHKLDKLVYGWVLEGVQAYVWTTPLKGCSAAPPSSKDGNPGATASQIQAANRAVKDPLAQAGIPTKPSLNDPLQQEPQKAHVLQKPEANPTPTTATPGSLSPIAGPPGATKQAAGQASAAANAAPAKDKLPSLLELLSTGEKETSAPTSIIGSQADAAKQDAAQQASASTAGPASASTLPTRSELRVETTPSTPDLAVRNPWQPAHPHKPQVHSDFLKPPITTGKYAPEQAGFANKRALTPLIRYWSGERRDHFYTTQTFNMKGWDYQGVQAYVFKHHQPGTIPLFRYFDAENVDHFYSIKYKKNGEGNYKYQGIVGFVTERKHTGQVPLLQYYNAIIHDHFYTTNWAHLGQGKDGWQFEGVQGYVYGPTEGSTTDASQAAAPDNWKGGLKPVALYAYYSAENKDHFYSTSGQWAPQIDKNGRTIKPAKAGKMDSYVLKGIIGQVYLNQAPKTVPLHRYYNRRVRDHFYTTNWMTLGKGGKHGWVYEGVQGYVYHTHEEGSHPLYRYYRDAAHDHIYTSKFEGKVRTTDDAALQGIACYIVPYVAETKQSSVVNAIPRTALYRYFNKKTNDHFYTINAKLLGNPGRNGWQYQGIAAYVPTQQSNSTANFYTYFNSYSQDHFYTRNFDVLGKAGKFGWKYQGVENLVFVKHEQGTVPLHRYYNRRVKDHYYTTNFDVLGNAGTNGWTYQGIEGFVFPPGSI